jgi:predicted ATPase with chaperone activity
MPTRRRRNDSELLNLFLDERPEFNRDALEVLRQPLKDGVVNVARASASYAYPAESSEHPPHPADQLAENTPRPKGARPLFCNAQMGPKEIRAYCAPSEEVKGLLRAAIQQLGLSARAYDRLLKVTRTIADLEGSKDIRTPHVAETIQHRSRARKFWGS